MSQKRHLRLQYGRQRGTIIDPEINFLRHVTIRALIDYLYPPRCLSLEEKQTAADFCLSPDGQEIIVKLSGLPETKVSRVLLAR